MIERIKDSQKDLNADTKELEYEFWNTKLAMTKQGSDQWWQIWEKMASLYRAMCNQQQQETDKMAKDAAAAGKNAAQMQKSDSDTAIKLQKQKLDMQYSLGQISASERLKQETQLDNQEYGLELNAAYKHLALVMQESNATKDAISKAWLEIEKLQNQHSLVMQKNENQAMQAMKQTWDKYSQEVGSVLTGLAFKHQTMLQTMQSLTEKAFSMMTNWALKELGVWVLNEMEKTAATTAGVAARTTAESAGAATSFMVQAGAVLKSILASAAETFAGIFGFLAPEMGPAAAVPAGAGMAVVLGVAKGLVSLDVGAWEIPHNMVAQLHQGETVVPKSFAEGMRNGGGIGGGG
jgi:K+/H+ antiporter YhaU regulatory subunit KhtT